jgi:hypothetical protein
VGGGGAHAQGTDVHASRGDDASNYAKALSETDAGISSAANDFTTYHSGTTGEANHWYQFRIQRGTDISAGKYLVDLLKQRSDPRLTAYFAPGPSASGQIIGASPGEEFNGLQAWLSATRGASDFRQPILTFAENQLIRAEAQYKTGVEPAALATLNAYRVSIGLTPKGALAGAALLTAIMEEKYVALFQNTEVWNDYRRTCYPNLTPASGTFIRRVWCTGRMSGERIQTFRRRRSSRGGMRMTADSDVDGWLGVFGNSIVGGWRLAAGDCWGRATAKKACHSERREESPSSRPRASPSSVVSRGVSRGQSP